MTALAKSKANKQIVASGMDFAVAANVKGYKGGLAVLASGYVKPAVVATGLFVLGRFEEDFDNTGGSAAAIKAPVEFGKERRFFRLIGDPDNPFTQADVGTRPYILDDQTVTPVSTGKTQMPGAIFKLETKGDVQLVHVEIV